MKWGSAHLAASRWTEKGQGLRSGKSQPKDSAWKVSVNFTASTVQGRRHPLTGEQKDDVTEKVSTASLDRSRAPPEASNPGISS